MPVNVPSFTPPIYKSSSGKIGVNNPNPIEALDVFGAIQGGNGTIKGAISYATGPFIGSFSAHPLQLAVNSIEAAQIDTAQNFKFNSGFGTVANAYGCRAWVNFNGTGTVAIRASGNVSSITDNGVGDYTVNFTNAMPDANYAEALSAGNSAGLFVGYYPALTKTSSALRIRTAGITSQSLTDLEWVSVSIFR